MKTRIMITVLLAALLVVPLGTGAIPRAVAQDGDSHLLRLMAMVPDTEGAREWVQFGDVAAWYTAWNIPRVPSLRAVDLLPSVPHARWMMIMPKQTAPAQALGTDSLLQGDQVPFYGFDFFNVDRFIAAGSPPDDLTVVDHNADAGQVGATLTASGYTAEDLGGDWTLYGILGDYQMALGADIDVPFAGRTGQRNRIALAGEQMMIARATGVITASLDAAGGETPSLADVPVFAAAARALDDPSLADTGPLVGAILMQGPLVGDPLEVMMGPALTAEEQQAKRDELGDSYAPGKLTVYDAVLFATSHSADAGATFLTLALVFPPSTDSGAAADVLVTRIQTYISARIDAPLDDRWTFDRAAGVEVDGLPVALVTMRIDDPTGTNDAGNPNTSILSWADLVYARDFGFLATGEPLE